MRNSIYNAYALLTFSVLVDMSIQIVIIWKILEITNSTILMGAIVCIGALTPLIFSILTKGNKSIYEPKLVGLFRIIIAIALIFSLKFDLLSSNIFMVSLAIISSTLMVCSINTIEIFNSQYVQLKLIRAEISSRVVQTSIQMGGFIGALLGGWYLQYSGFESYILFVAFASVFLSTGFLLIKRKDTSDFSKENKNNSKSSGFNFLNTLKQFSPQILLIAITGFHIGSFNILVPVFFQLHREWGAEILGLASGIAGIGALTAALIPCKKAAYWIAGICLVLGDLGLYIFDYSILAASSCFLIGYAINTIRINTRTKILLSTYDSNEINNAITLSNYIFYIVSAVIPISITYAFTLLNVEANTYGTALIVVGLISMVITITNKSQRIKEQQYGK
ncbi:hypothetical protein [Aliivibrio fischeri]|uniref:hypothetical protein n=1 Tax=Aliivibrio fischeri TaxID=668 RepID=UPI00080DC3F2|nr:hypothetical protein [Aliivibrio fischeri]OCH38079.1 hypothetical protein A6E02_18150 [Aliivibrio fischeri]